MKNEERHHKAVEVWDKREFRNLDDQPLLLGGSMSAQCFSCIVNDLLQVHLRKLECCTGLNPTQVQ